MPLELHDVTYRYPGAASAAVADVNATVRPGITGLVGVNGAGKSTLLRMLSRGLRPTSGRIALDGRDVYGPPRREVAARIAIMPQSFQVPRDARVLDVLLYCGWLKGVTGARAAARAEEVLQQVDLGDRAHQRIGQLSGGMVRRVAFAQALMSRPRVLLLDEPTTGLDPEQRAHMRSLLIEEFARTDAAVLMSSHLMEDIEATADHVLLLHEGSLRYAGALEDFKRMEDGQTVAAESAFLQRIMRAS